jgi:hypothetical protein
MQRSRLLSGFKRRPFLSIFLLGGLIVALYQLWHEGQSVAFTAIVREGVLRGNLDAYPAMPALYIIPSLNDVDHFAQQVLGGEPAIPGQPQRFVEQLRSLDYHQVFAVVVVSGQRGGCDSFTIRRMTRWNARVIIHADFDTGGWGRGCPQVVTDPAYLLAVAKANLPTTPIQFDLWDGWRTVATTTATIPR